MQDAGEALLPDGGWDLVGSVEGKAGDRAGRRPGAATTGQPQAWTMIQRPRGLQLRPGDAERATTQACHKREGQVPARGRGHAGAGCSQMDRSLSGGEVGNGGHAAGAWCFWSHRVWPFCHYQQASCLSHQEICQLDWERLGTGGQGSQRVEGGQGDLLRVASAGAFTFMNVRGEQGLADGTKLRTQS